MISYKDLWDMPMTAESAARQESGAKPIPHAVGNVIYAVLGSIFKVAFRYKVVGIDHLRSFSDGRGCVVAGNHVSYLDPVFLWLAARPS